MVKFLVVALLIAASGIAPAEAQTKKELVAKLLQLQQTGIENLGRQIAAQNSQRALQASGQVISRMPADKREAAAKDVQAEVKKFYDDIEPLLRKRAADLAPAMVAPMYEERFSEDELKQVIAWLGSPVSKKFQQVDGEIAKSLAQKVVEESRPTIEPKLKALEATVAKRLGLPLAGAASSAASGAKK
jgi:hypothetical protein